MVSQLKQLVHTVKQIMFYLWLPVIVVAIAVFYKSALTHDGYEEVTPYEPSYDRCEEGVLEESGKSGTDERKEELFYQCDTGVLETIKDKGAAFLSTFTDKVSEFASGFRLEEQ